MNIPVLLKRAVLRRAGNACEYCGLSQAGQEARFHVDHIQPRAEGGETLLGNLALACVSCSLRKGARRSVTDSVSGQNVPLFHPRTDRWPDHFTWEGCRVRGRTITGRATIETLKMNRPLALAIRLEEAARGRHPPRPALFPE